MALAETYLFYSSLTLVAMGCSTLVLSILFRSKHHWMKRLPRSLSANVFDKTFNVFNPYPEQRGIIHSVNFISMLPAMIVVFAFTVLLFFAWALVASGLLLSVILLITCLNLMLLEVASDTYQNAKVFMKAFNNRANFGAGDLKVFETLKRVMPRLSNYYLALSILFLALAATLGYIWPSLLWSFARFAGLMLEVQALTGSAVGFQVALILIGLVVFVVQIVIWKIKSKFLTHLLGAEDWLSP